MKKIEGVIFSIIFLCFFGVVLYSYDLYKNPVIKEDPKEKDFLSMEMKYSKIKNLVQLIENAQYDEAYIAFERYSEEEQNPFISFYKGFIYYKVGKKEEGLEKIKKAIQTSPVLYDEKYPHNVRKMLEKVLDEINKTDNLKHYRHFLESKLKGGCG